MCEERENVDLGVVDSMVAVSSENIMGTDTHVVRHWVLFSGPNTDAERTVA